MTTSKKKASVGLVKGIIAPDTEGYIDIAELKVNGEALGHHLNRMVQLEHLLKDVSTRLDLYKIELKAFLLARGYNTSSDNISALFHDLAQVKTLSPQDQHHIAQIKDGYVADVLAFELDQLIINQAIPLDVKDGYYKVKAGQFVLDDTRKEELEGLE